jgi:hypothetical protein
MATKKKLIVAYEFDFNLYGLISSVKGYKLAWQINQLTGVHLVKQDDLVLEFISSDKLFISNYLFTTEHSMIRLVRNRAYTDNPDNQVFLIPELKRFDYLLMLKGTIGDYSENQLINKLKTVGDIQFISQLNISRIKSRDNLIFT